MGTVMATEACALRLRVIEQLACWFPNCGRVAGGTVIRRLEVGDGLARSWRMIAVMAGEAACSLNHGIIVVKAVRDPGCESGVACFASVGRWQVATCCISLACRDGSIVAGEARFSGNA